MKSNQKSKLFQWQQKHNEEGGVCQKCLRDVKHLTVDHIIPSSFVLCLDNGRNLAINDEENFQVLCQPCNKMKGSAWDFTNPKTVTLLKKYLQQYGFN